MDRNTSDGDSAWRLRPATNADASAVIQLIGDVYSEYGEVMCLDGADKDLHQLEVSYAGRGGAFVVLESLASSSGPSVMGCHATLPLIDSPGVCTFRRLYLHSDLRGRGWGDLLMQWAIDWAKEQGCYRIVFWSDTRFERAHRFFERLGFKRTGEVRRMTDGVLPYDEYFFAMDLPVTAV